MWWNLLVFAVIGLFSGAAVRLFYPGRQPLRILGTLALGIVGALLGGMLSWFLWSEVDGQFASGALLMSLTGAATVLVIAAGVSYARRVSGRA
jgi:uncharacterized membrane protein YeaQ/YmgE (transglycosylase-associated protein family)